MDGFAVDFTDGSSTPWRGGQGGVPLEFTLDEGGIPSAYLFLHTNDIICLGEIGEDITGILISYDDQQIRRMRFISSNGS